MLVLTIVMMCAVFIGAFFMLASGETDRTVVLTREIQATIIGEGVAARIAALVSPFPWKDRFFKKNVESDPDLTFTNRTFPFWMDSGVFRSDASFVGSCGDLPGVTNTYRIKLEVNFQGQRVRMVWDKVYPQSLLGVSSEDTTQIAANLDLTRPDQVDGYIDGLRNTARQNRGDGSLSQGDLGWSVDGALGDRRSNRNPGHEILEGRKQ